MCSGQRIARLLPSSASCLALTLTNQATTLAFTPPCDCMDYVTRRRHGAVEALDQRCRVPNVARART